MKTKIIIALLILMNIVLFFKVNSNNFNSKYTKKGESSSYKYPYKQSLLLNGSKIQDGKIISLKNKEYKINDIIKNKKGLILLYDKISCNSCIDSLIINFNSISRVSDSNSVIIAVAYSASQEYLRRFARINKMQFPIYLDETEYLVKKLRIEIFPTVIMFNDNAEIVNSFSLNRSNKELNPTFFRSVSYFLNYD